MQFDCYFFIFWYFYRQNLLTFFTWDFRDELTYFSSDVIYLGANLSVVDFFRICSSWSRNCTAEHRNSDCHFQFYRAKDLEIAVLRSSSECGNWRFDFQQGNYSSGPSNYANEKNYWVARCRNTEHLFFCFILAGSTSCLIIKID